MNENFNLNLQLFADEAQSVPTQDAGEPVTTRQLNKAREVDFVNRFSGGVLQQLLDALGVSRRILRQEGTTLYIYKTEGELQDGAVEEGAVIPLSQYKREKRAVGDVVMKKWRKATTAEAIDKAGYAEAVRETDKGLMADVQKGVRAEFFEFLNGLVQPASGTEGQDDYVPATGVSVTGDTLQAVLAKSWGQLQVLFEDDAVQAVHFINPLTIADFLATAQISMQTAFGMNYVENFLGLGTVVMSSLVPQGQVISTAKENIILYYMNMNGDIARGLELTADETGFIGIRSGYPNGERAQVESMVVSGVKFLVESADGVVKGTVA